MMSPNRRDADILADSTYLKAELFKFTIWHPCVTVVLELVAEQKTIERKRLIDII